MGAMLAQRRGVAFGAEHKVVCRAILLVDLVVQTLGRGANALLPAGFCF